MADCSTFGSGYNNETQIIGTKGTLHVGRFCGYPGPVPVEVYTSDGKISPLSRTFEMSYLERPFPEFLPRFKRSYETAHVEFQRVCRDPTLEFRVSQREILDAQVLVEAAHISATRLKGAPVHLRHSDDVGEFRAHCVASQLLEH